MSSGSLYWEDRGEEGRTRFEAVGQRGRLYVVEDGSDGQYVAIRDAHQVRAMPIAGSPLRFSWPEHRTFADHR